MICSTEYKDKAAYRTSFNKLAGMVFGLDFEEWYQRGCWDERYICHSIAEGGEIIANVSASKLDLVVSGQTRRAVQIGTVMTHPDHRGQGYAACLMQQVLDTYADTCDFVYLFANRSVLDFYPRFGFSPVKTTEYEMEAPAETGRSVISAKPDKLDITSASGFGLLQQMLAVSRPVSDRLGVVNNTGLFAFYAMSVFPGSLYYWAEQETVVVAGHEGETLHLYDVVSPAPVRLEKLLPALCTGGTKKIRFHFTPDSLLDRAYPVESGDAGEVLFARPGRELDAIAPVCYPKLAQA